jgi:hypothetical protein
MSHPGASHKEPAPPSRYPVPLPVRTVTEHVTCADHDLTDEQRDRICTWLTANGINPERVVPEPITVETKQTAYSERTWIGITEYLVGDDGSPLIDHRRGAAVTADRWVKQTVALEPEPHHQRGDAT